MRQHLRLSSGEIVASFGVEALATARRPHFASPVLRACCTAAPTLFKNCQILAHMNYSSVKEFFASRSAIIPEDDYKKVLGLLKDMEEKESPGARERSDALKTQGNEAYGRGAYEEALGFYTRALAADPLNAPVYSNRALVHAKLGRDQEGIDDCLSGLKIDPKFIKLYVRIGMFYMKTDRAKAHSYFAQGLEIDPENEHLRDLADSTAADAEPDAGAQSKLEQLMGNKAVQDAVKNFVKDKSPGELAEMMKGAFSKFK